MKKYFLDSVKRMKGDSGFALLFSVVILSIVILVALAVNAIVQRGFDMTTIGERSMEAFFAADAGMECAQLYDIHGRDGGVSRFDPPQPSGPSFGQMRCFEQNITVQSPTTGSLPGEVGEWSISRFNIQDDTRDMCAEVLVGKRTQDGSDDLYDTRIISYGRNTCSDAASERVIERALKAEY